MSTELDLSSFEPQSSGTISQKPSDLLSLSHEEEENTDTLLEKSIREVQP